MKVNLLRKPLYEELIPQTEVVIEKVIELSIKDMNHFIHNPLEDNKLIEENADLMGFDKDGICHCIAFKAEGHPFAIIIDSEGSSYARYASAIPVEALPEPINPKRKELYEMCERTKTSKEGTDKLVEYYIKSLGWTEDEACEYAMKLFKNGTIDEIKFIGKDGKEI